MHCYLRQQTWPEVQFQGLLVAFAPTVQLPERPLELQAPAPLGFELALGVLAVQQELDSLDLELVSLRLP